MDRPTSNITQFSTYSIHSPKYPLSISPCEIPHTNYTPLHYLLTLSYVFHSNGRSCIGGVPLSCLFIFSDDCIYMNPFLGSWMCEWSCQELFFFSIFKFFLITLYLLFSCLEKETIGISFTLTLMPSIRDFLFLFYNLQQGIAMFRSRFCVTFLLFFFF
jgi:hypothetical protein